MTPCPKCKAVMTVDFQVPYCVRCERSAAPAESVRLWTVAYAWRYTIGQAMNCMDSYEAALFEQRLDALNTLVEVALCPGKGEPEWYPLEFSPLLVDAPVGHRVCMLYVFPDEAAAKRASHAFPKAIVLSGAQVRR